ncbi:hypothetical protein JRQ81_017836, partial [Phrynocephalus forsythii]
RKSHKMYRLQKNLDVPKVLYQNTSMESYVEGKSVEEKGRNLERIVRKRPSQSVRCFHKERTEAGVSASRATTQRQILGMGFKCCIPLVKLLLNTVAQWSKVLFSDESNFCISFGNQGPKIWRKNGEAQNARCLKSSVKFLQSVLLWGAMSSAGVGPLCFIKPRVNAAIYQEILECFMLPSKEELYGDADFIFQQDLAPAHTAKNTKTSFHDHGITVLVWPANLTDLNLKRKMRDMRPNNAAELKHPGLT